MTEVKIMAHNNKKEPLFHIVKRDDLSAAKTWGIRGIGILAGFIFICIIFHKIIKVQRLHCVKKRNAAIWQHLF